MVAPTLIAVLLSLGTAVAVNHSLSYLPFSWDTIPRYTFCSNSSVAYASEGYGGIGLFNNDSLHYIAKQDIMLYGTAEHRPPGGLAYLDESAPVQAKALRAINPDQQQWFYYAIDLVRPHDFYWDGDIAINNTQCLLHDDAGEPMTRTVWDFGNPCGVEHWLNTSRSLITRGGLNGIFIDGFQGCNPFVGTGCQRVCKSRNSTCSAAKMKAWNEGLVKAMWTLKREILGENGTLICNYTPGPFACDPSKPVSECPCDGTNDERGGGNFEHMQIIKKIEDAQDDYAMLTHVPHGNNDAVLLKSITGFLLGTTRYQYHGAGFDYDCSGGGWLGRGKEVEHAYGAPLGAPLGDALSSSGSIMTRKFATGTKVFLNSTNKYSQGCLMWSDGVNTETGVAGGCAQAATWPW